MSLRLTLFLVAFALVIAGGELVYKAAAMPEWTDQAKFELVQAWNPPDDTTGPAADAFNHRWAKAINKLRTPKWATHDAGVDLIAFAFSLVAGLLLLRVNTIADLHKLTTPKRPLAIFGVTLLAWFAFWASVAVAIVRGVDRFEFPPSDDSQIAQVIVIAIFAAVSAVVIGVRSYFILHKAHLPASLWLWRKDMPGHDWFYTIGAGISVLLALEALRESILFGHWLAIPAVMLWVYATLTLRAAGISKPA